MPSPTKSKTCIENSDMDTLKEINVGLHQNLRTTLDFFSNADIKKFIDKPSNLSILLLSGSVIEEIEKFLTNPKVEKIQNSLYLWQTELIYHYNRFITQVKSQPNSIIIKFLQENFAVDLMQPIPLTPRKSARLQAREKKTSPKKEVEESHHSLTDQLHPTLPVARKLIFDFNETTKSQISIEPTSDKLKRNAIKR